MSENDRPDVRECDWSPCSCGGNYRLGYELGLPVLHHSLPTCAGYDAADDTIAAVRFSRRQREWLAGQTSKELGTNGKESS